MKKPQILNTITLIEKIKYPTLKNLPTNEFIVIGIILLILIFINLKWVFNFFKVQPNIEYYGD